MADNDILSAGFADLSLQLEGKDAGLRKVDAFLVVWGLGLA